MQDAPKAVWSIPCVSVAFFPSLKQNFIAHPSSKVSSRPDCIFEINQLWQSGFRRVYSNSCCSCSFETEIIKIGQSSHKMYNNNIVNFQESTTILNACTKKSGNLLKASRMYVCTCVRARACLCMCICMCVFVHVFVCLCVWLCMCIYVCMWVSAFVYVYVCVYVCMCLTNIWRILVMY